MKVWYYLVKYELCKTSNCCQDMTIGNLIVICSILMFCQVNLLVHLMEVEIGLRSLKLDDQASITASLCSPIIICLKWTVIVVNS